MEELSNQVKKELLRTLFWFIMAMAISTGAYYFMW